MMLLVMVLVAAKAPSVGICGRRSNGSAIFGGRRRFAYGRLGVGPAPPAVASGANKPGANSIAIGTGSAVAGTS